MNTPASSELLSTSPVVAELDMDPSLWDTHVEELIATDTHVIALRGAGKANGISPESAARAVDQLSKYIDVITDQGVPVEIMYDGDEDRPNLPDIGHIFGGLADMQKGKRVSFVAVQTHDRYTKQAPDGGPLASSSGTPYHTFTFSPDLPGGHARFTQSDELVQYGGYEQIIVGQTGPGVAKQLADLNRKAAGRSEGPVPVAVIDVPGDPAVDAEIARQLSRPDLDNQTREKLEKRVLQRLEHPRGFLFDHSGNFAVSEGQYPHIDFCTPPIN